MDYTSFFLSGVFYGTVLNLCFLYQSQGLRVLTMCFNNVCVRVFYIRSAGFSFKHMPGTSSRLQASRGNKKGGETKSFPWLQATDEAATQDFKISFFSEIIYSHPLPTSPKHPRIARAVCSDSVSLWTGRSSFCTGLPSLSSVRNDDVGFSLSPRCPLTAPHLHRLRCCPTIYGPALRKLHSGAGPLLYSGRKVVSVSDRLGDINSCRDGRIMHGAFSSPQLRTGRGTGGKRAVDLFSGHSKNLLGVQEEPLINYYRHHHHL